ncbi:MAG TPA: calcineurin-like phosphoesterase C-terminal domain-containing protein [Candidatus Bathyarchaeia archaeon]|nr:calcineurin-like phosphoesterase C-terminal domain-containing protein [Candidatus Bathyarchaeia archaeon]
MKKLALIVALITSFSLAAAADTARGVVFNDANGNGARDPGEKGMSGVAVSNGRDVVRTDSKGRWELPYDDDVILFVVKPTGWMTPLSADNLPRFYYIHRPAGAPPTDVPGVGPTGPLPESIDFALRKQKEPRKFQVLLFGDTQVNDVAELNYAARDVVEELVGNGAAFGISLGDNVGDSPELQEPLVGAVGRIGIPWYNTIGNHDGTPGAREDSVSDDIFERIYGPPTYAFEYGGVSFIVLDSILVKEKGYDGGFREDQVAFVKNYLDGVPHDRLIVMTMHIPFRGKSPLAMFDVLAGRPHTFSVAAHTHTMFHVFFDETRGWKGPNPHHQFVNGTVCGSWWAGLRDETGIPHSVMNDGAPNGYAVATFDGASYKIEYKAARRPADYQMNIYLPDEIASADVEKTEVLVNVFAGSENSKVEMRADGGKWLPLDQTTTFDPFCVRMYQENKFNQNESLGYHFDEPREITHMWKSKLPRLAPGAHAIEVRTKDMFGHTYSARKVVRVL